MQCGSIGYLPSYPAKSMTARRSPSGLLLNLADGRVGSSRTSEGVLRTSRTFEGSLVSVIALSASGWSPPRAGHARWRDRQAPLGRIRPLRPLPALYTAVQAGPE